MAEYGLNKNSEGYSDPTPCAAVTKVMREENERQRRVSVVVGILKNAADLAGFDLVNRVVLRDRKTGREYR